VIGEVVIVLTLLTVSPNLGDDTLANLRTISIGSVADFSFARLESGALAVKVNLDLRLFKITRVTPELNSVNVSTRVTAAAAEV